jgi:hypothetical protein
MPAKPPLTDTEIYDLLHGLWLRLDGKRGESEHGEAALRRVSSVIQMQQGNLVANMERLAEKD